MPAGRPPGAKNRPGYRKPGRKPGAAVLNRYTPDDILYYKAKILELFEDGECTTLTGAAEKLGIPATRVHFWASNDKDFGQMVKLAREVVADRLESELQGHKNFIPQMFILKAYRPMFRENSKVEMLDDKMRVLLEELRTIGQRTQEEIEAPAETPQQIEAPVALPAPFNEIEIKEGVCVE